MARVPVYGGPQVERTALQPVMQGQLDVSSGLRAAGQALGQVAVDIDRGQRRDAEAEANRIDSEITAGWLEWDATNRRKYQGQNVEQYQEEAGKWWDKARETYGKNLNPLAQQAVGPALARKRNQAMGSVLGHVSAEKERFADDSAEAAAQTTIDFSVDTGDTAGGAARVRAIAAEKGARKGWTTEQTQAEQQRLLGTLHLAYISKTAEGNPEKAQAYYTANKGEIPAAAQARVEQVLKGEADNQFATQFAARQAAKPLGEQLAAAADIKDPERREKTLLQIRNNHAQVKAAQAEREAAASDDAWQMVGKGQRVPEKTLMQMNGRERVQLQDYLRDRAKVAASGAAVKTDPVFLAKIYDMARDDPEQFKKLRMEGVALKVAGSDMEQVAKLQRDMNKPDAEKDAISLSAQIGTYTKALKTPKAKAELETAAHSEIMRFQEEKKRLPNSTERKALLDALVMDVIVEDNVLWFDSTMPAYKVPADKRGSVTGPANTPANAQRADKFTAGQVYKDANGNRAKYLGNNKWEPVQ